MPFRKAEAITRKIRECSSCLEALDDALRGDVDITAGMRGVMGSLYESGSQTVPQIARLRRVSRQHIQVLADKLVTAELVSTRNNPGDRRSPLFMLTKQGEAIFERMRQREIGALTDLSRALRDCDLDAALTTLDTLQTYLKQKLSKETDRQA
jgi:DNA-binding MarR family transcriptional regulator